jgi:hypothetical protein
MASDRWIIATRPRIAAHAHCTFGPRTQKARRPSRPDFDKKRRLRATCGCAESPLRKRVSRTSSHKPSCHRGEVIHSATHLRDALWEKWIEIVSWRFRPRLPKLPRPPRASAWPSRFHVVGERSGTGRYNELRSLDAIGHAFNWRLTEGLGWIPAVVTAPGIIQAAQTA